MRRATTAETEPTRTIGQSPWGSGGKTHRNRAPRTSDLSKGISRPKKKIQDFGPYLLSRNPLVTNDREPVQRPAGGNPGNHLTQDPNRVGSFSPRVRELNVLKILKKSRPRFFGIEDCCTFNLSPKQIA